MMKQVFGPTASALIAAATLCAATPAAGQTMMGVSVGATFSTFEGDDADDAGTSTGFMAGAHLSFPLSEIVSLVPGAYYVQKGAEYENEGISQTISYLEVPVLLSVGVLQGDRPVGLSLFAGPEVGFKVGCDIEAEEGDDDIADCDEIVSSTDFGLVAGAGLSFGRFFVNGGLDLGLKSISDLDSAPDITNSAWFLAGGISFPLGG